MGRKRKAPTFRQPDPARAARIQAMRQGELKMRAAVEPALKAAKELGDRMHYHKLSTESQARAQGHIEAITALIDERLVALTPCFLATHELRRECETLQRDLDALDGHPPKPDILDAAEPLLAQCSPEQAAALRGVLLDASLPAPPAPETTDAFDVARTYVERLTATRDEVRRETDMLFEIAAEKVRRGWMPQAEIDSRRPPSEAFLADTEKCVAVIRSSFESALADYASLQERRCQLRQALRRHERP